MNRTTQMLALILSIRMGKIKNKKPSKKARDEKNWPQAKLFGYAIAVTRDNKHRSVIWNAKCMLIAHPNRLAVTS